jgi:membrane protein YdbS with pleckstrin-like domain
MIDHLTFECPHCKQSVDVKEERLGGNIDCPHCDRTFQANAPLGRLMGDGRGEGGQTDPADIREQTLKVVRPVLFRQHLVTSAIALVLMVFALAGLTMYFLDRPLLRMEGGVLLTLSIIAALIAIGFVIGRVHYTYSTSLTITTARSILREGILSIRTSEVRHNDVRSIRADRNTLERMFNYGDIAISSAGQDDFEIVVHDIPDPESVLEIIRRHQSNKR